MSRIIADIASNKILQVESTPELGEFREFGGRYLVPIPDGAAVDVDSTSVIIPQNGTTDVAALAAAALLARYPMYSNIAYNFLLEPGDVDDLDLSAAPAVSPISGFTARTRAQTGRGSVLPGPVGQVPTMTGILPANTLAAPPRPGMLITDTIDIGPATGGAGADEFLLWWQIYRATTWDDIASDYGVFANTNQAGRRLIAETDQEPGSFSVWISHDDGVTWTAIARLEPTDLTVFDTDVRIAFVNGTPSEKVYLAAYAVMF